LFLDRALVAEFAGHLDGILPGLFVREVLGEEHIRAIHAGHTPHMINSVTQFMVRGLSVVAHTVIVTEGKQFWKR